MRSNLLIRDVTLRDGHQSLFATRMGQAQVDRLLPFYKEAGFYALEVWGGAVPDSIMRYLNENPWERLEKIKAAIGDVSKLTALSRGRNLFGYNPYPEDVIEGFNRNAVQSGIDIMRIFDALNDVNNIKSTITYVKQNGGIADCTICYTVDPKFSTRERMKALLHGKMLPYRIFTKDYFLTKARELEALGADMITIKDMAGLIPPGKTGRLMKLLKSELKVPVDFHTHCTPGYGTASTLMAILNGVDIVDVAIGAFAGGPAAPPFEIIQIFCNKLGIDTGVDLKAVGKINKELRSIREELAKYDSYKLFPIEFDISSYKLPKDIDQLFDLAIREAKEDKEDDLLETVLEIEKYFNYPEPDIAVKKAEIPGGMYTNMLQQLKQLKLEDLLPRVLELVPVVRVAAGCPPLVTPTSQIVGVQAVNCIIDENNKAPYYTNKSIQFVNLVKGIYGKTPMEIDPEFRKKIAGVSKETPYDTSTYRKQPNPKLNEFGGARLAQNEKDALLLELFPAVASSFLLVKAEEKFWADIFRVEEEKRNKIQKDKDLYEALTPEQKKKRLEEGLYNF
jgi:pyruvate/oxaloacetate carboxyltransferase